MSVSLDQYPLLEKVARLRPSTALDVGCGCGEETVRLAQYCGEITAIDVSERLIERCIRENFRDNITYLHMDGKEMTLPDKSFDLVMERDSLHHVDDWQKMLREMVRVSADYILIQEPVDDPRSAGKRNAMAQQKLMLEVQHEAGYSHFEHIKADDFRIALNSLPVTWKEELTRRDELVEWREYEEPFNFFAEKSARKQYWLDRFAGLKDSLAEGELCKTDILFIVARKKV
jgi:SAM-dependent methyltransferase